jgi:hypothetical protein
MFFVNNPNGIEGAFDISPALKLDRAMKILFPTGKRP